MDQTPERTILTNPANRFAVLLSKLPLIAILRGLRSEEAVECGNILVEAGFRLIEVPLNSPDPFASIERLAHACGTNAMIGAGTVLRPDDVDRARNAGGAMIISPNTDPDVIKRTAEAGLVSLPGAFTPSEAFRALQCGATALKLFPAEAARPEVLKAMRAVLPEGTRVLPVGGITPAAMTGWWAAGAAGFGLGSALYRPGDTPATLATNAQAFVAAYHTIAAG